MLILYLFIQLICYLFNINSYCRVFLFASARIPRLLGRGMNNRGEPAEALAKAGLLRRMKAVSILEAPSLSSGSLHCPIGRIAQLVRAYASHA